MTETKDSFTSAAEILCDELKSIMQQIPEGKKAHIQEIRLRNGKPLALSEGSAAMFVDSSGKILYSPGERAFRVTSRHIYETFRRLCSYSVYSHQNEIRNGFITVKGGHRVGLCGTAVVTDGRVSAVNDISSLNIRIARQVSGAAEELIGTVCPLEGGLLIVGAPAAGKTTMLRDIAYRLSLGVGCKIMRTSVIDERGELSGTYSGSAYNDLGLCDVLNGYPKGEGIIHALRALSPQVIICDELGSEEDCRMVSEGFNAGAYIIATIHAAGYEELMRRPQAKELLHTGAFRTVVILESADRPCRISQLIRL